jgi:ubiquinone biosynthesis protein COQ9
MPSPPDQLQELKDQLLMASLPHIVFDGWSKSSLNAGSISIGKEIGYPYSLFSDPVKEMVAHFSNWADREMLKKLDAIDLQSLKIRQRIATSVRYRLESLADHEEAVARSLFYLSPRSLYETVDLIWRTAGDTSVDFNFYTKRMLLSAVLTSTTACWLADKSEGHNDTWDFLDRRIEDVMQIPKLNAFFQSKVEKCFGSIRGRFS